MQFGSLAVLTRVVLPTASVFLNGLYRKTATSATRYRLDVQTVC